MPTTALFAGETDYSMNFYVADILFLLCVIATVWKLNLKVEKARRRGMVKNLRVMVNPAIGMYIGIIACTGITMGVTDNYVNVYLKNGLGASAQMLGQTYSVAVAARILGSLCANVFISSFGLINLMVVGQLINCLRLFLYGLIKYVIDVPLN